MKDLVIILIVVLSLQSCGLRDKFRDQLIDEINISEAEKLIQMLDSIDLRELRIIDQKYFHLDHNKIVIIDTIEQYENLPNHESKMTITEWLKKNKLNESFSTRLIGQLKKANVVHVIIEKKHISSLREAGLTQCGGKHIQNVRI